MPATVTLPFLNAGQPFQIRVFLEDLERYEETEKKAGEAKRLSGMVRARADFVTGMLKASPDFKADAPVKLTTDEVDAAFWAIWRAAQGTGPDPLE